MASFTPQEIEQFLQQFFDVVGTRQYIGARYVPIFGRKGEDTIEWDKLAPYEPLTVVMHQGVSYVSKQYVPKDVEITDTNYWAETYRFNAQVEQYRQEVLSFQGQINATNAAIDTLRDDVADEYVPFPIDTHYPKYGADGQVLSSLGDGETVWVDPVIVTSEIAGPIISEWLDDHPEATTTVEDGSVGDAKLSPDGVLKSINKMNNLNGYIDADSNHWTATVSIKYAIIGVKPNQQIKLKTGNYSSSYAFLRTYEFENGETPDYSSATQQIVIIQSSSTVNVVVPSDANYMYLFGGYSGTRYPSTILIDGYDYAATIPDNVTNLMDNIDSIETEITSTNVAEVLKGLTNTAKLGFINADTNKWATSGSNFGHAVLSVKSGQSVTIDASTRETSYTFLKTYNPVIGTQPDYSDNTQQVILVNNTTVETTVPSDANYLYVFAGTNGDRLPNGVLVDGYDYSYSIRRHVTELEDFADEVSSFSTSTNLNALIESLSETVADGFINADTNKWATSGSNFGHAVLSVKSGQSVTIDASTRETSYTFLKTYNPVIGTNADYSDSTQQVILINQTSVDTTVPSDANYLYVFAGTNGDRLPNGVLVDGYDYMSGIKSHLTSLDDNATYPPDSFLNMAPTTNIISACHGGGYQGYPYNSLDGFKVSKTNGFDWVEADVRFTLDNVPVLTHNNDIEVYARNPDGTRPEGVLVSETTYNDLLYYSFGVLDGQLVYPDMKITTLEQLVSLARNVNLNILLDVKASPLPTLEQYQIAYNILKKYHMQNKVLWGTTSQEMITTIHEQVSRNACFCYLIGANVTDAKVDFAKSIAKDNVSVFCGINHDSTNVSKIVNANLPAYIITASTEQQIIDADPCVSLFITDAIHAETVLYNNAMS